MPAGGVPTRIRLLEAAVAVMAEDGWTAVTSRGVAERADANNALVHYYFGSVDALRRAAVLHALEAEMEGPIAAILDAPDVLDGIVTAIADLTAPRATGDGTGPPRLRVVTEALVHGLRDEELRRETAGQLAAFRGALADRLAALRATGGLRGDADPAALAVVVCALIDGLLLHAVVDPRTDAAAATAGLLGLLRGPAGASPLESPGGPGREPSGGEAGERAE
ncbi:TetR/AcrR family transcriptional regulator [Actinomadura sp. WMMB 499]|uniref:TetR/AcrR family transcriptional regulator n=1 Tax=Actinomadura sp. WMMB 499 TaxID=1219491 RepID=UPI001248455A|nr:TetR/AcrR family transcriptional regulator [Actinomadura sp. WMMB 499]QFG19887.1 TetR/AcrR family transcriptional regulator [Actinomadura sp. WMMB 499]